MSINRTARGIVLVPSLLLGGAFLSAGLWLEGEAAANRPIALALGGVLLATGLLTQLLPEAAPESAPEIGPGGTAEAGPAQGGEEAAGEQP